MLSASLFTAPSSSDVADLISPFSITNFTVDSRTLYVFPSNVNSSPVSSSVYSPSGSPSRTAASSVDVHVMDILSSEISPSFTFSRVAPSVAAFTRVTVSSAPATSVSPVMSFLLIVIFEVSSVITISFSDSDSSPFAIV